MRWNRSFQPLQGAISEEATEETTGSGQDEGLDQELPNQSASTCTQRGPKSDLSFSRCRTSQQQSSNIRTGNQEQHEDCSQESVERAFEFPQEMIDERLR